jgi:hypothetical protein
MKRHYLRSSSRPQQPPVDQKAALVCARKRRYPDEITARASAASSIERHQNTDQLSVYRCQVCRGWHLTRFKVGIPVKAGDPVAEQDWRNELLAIARAGKVQTYRNCEHGDKIDQKWLHEACLTLEQEGKLRRHFEREHSVTWVLA